MNLGVATPGMEKQKGYLNSGMAVSAPLARKTIFFHGIGVLFDPERAQSDQFLIPAV
jgi:hypothetical protein